MTVMPIVFSNSIMVNGNITPIGRWFILRRSLSAGSAQSIMRSLSLRIRDAISPSRFSLCTAVARLTAATGNRISRRATVCLILLRFRNRVRSLPPLPEGLSAPLIPVCTTLSFRVKPCVPPRTTQSSASSVPTDTETQS